MDFQERDPPSLAESTQSAKPSSAQQASELWEVVEEPRGRLGAEGIMPERQEGHLLKKRKWPLKGWHKRYFVLEDGILHYATTRQDEQGTKGLDTQALSKKVLLSQPRRFLRITKGKLHGSIDVRLSVMSINKKAQRIDLDTEDNIYHLKIKSQDLFQSWVAQLRAHRLAQHLDVPRSLLPSTTHRKVPGAQLPAAGSASALPGVGPREKVSSWLRDSDGLDRCSHELSECQGKLQELHRLLQSLESLPRTPSAPVIPTHQASVTTERPKKGKRTSRIWCTQSFAKDDTIGRTMPTCSAVSGPWLRRVSACPGGGWEQVGRGRGRGRESDGRPAPTVHSSLSSVLAALTTERDRLRDLHQGSEPSRLAVSEAAAGPRRLHSLSVSSDTTADSFSSLNPEEQEALYMKGRELTPQLSQSSVLSLADSHTEFFDACEVLLSASSSENERLCEELEYSGLLDQASHTTDPCERMDPVYRADPRPPSWLTVYIAAFAVSAYCSTYHRAGCKPFNPVLGETYECERPDRGFRFISEQMGSCSNEGKAEFFQGSPTTPPSRRAMRSLRTSYSGKVKDGAGDEAQMGEGLEHSLVLSLLSLSLPHPTPDMKWKNKFWGKSLEIVPVGMVNVSLPRFGDHFEWNKVTSCIHNILSGQRWIEHYGEVLIRNTQDSSCHCKITFCKAKYWSSNVHEVQGWAVPLTAVWMLRYLEEGNIQAAEAQKRRIEQLQRDRRKVMEENNIVHQARFFRADRHVKEDGGTEYTMNSGGQASDKMMRIYLRKFENLQQN
ncbi:hypothetical protein E2I00_016591 [Balaenoptera physalus]|uniref:PH domain-containing protein n=1 Tax=Balaenoptera physalus TaxID=9770 RepID=A0A643BMW0_BALPH|nr:hypothetical protein E2I00_016591 [Balaenoptera physalus]